MITTCKRVLRMGLILVLFLMLAGYMTAQAPLQAHLEPEQSESVMGVPLEFRATVTNVSATPVNVARFYLNPRRGDLSLLISSDGSSFRVYSGPAWEAEEMSQPQITLQPGEKVAGTAFSVLVNRSDQNEPTDLAKDFAFPEPGTYFVKAGVATSLGLLTSNVVRVIIRQPHGDDVAVWDALKRDKKLARFLQTPEWENPAVEPAGAGKLKQLIDKYPHSSHAPWIRKALDTHAKYKALLEERRKANAPRQQP